MVTPARPAVVKDILRRAALARRDALDPDMRQAAAETVAARALPVAVAPGAIVSGFMPIGSEINPLPLMQALAALGAGLALPVVTGRGQRLIFRAWKPGDPLARRAMGLREPEAAAPEVVPGVLIVPLAAFDRKGYRIGYGAGYYDLTLNALRRGRAVAALGIAFAEQEVDAVPVEPHDARLDFVLTERETIDCRAA